MDRDDLGPIDIDPAEDLAARSRRADRWSPGSGESDRRLVRRSTSRIEVPCGQGSLLTKAVAHSSAGGSRSTSVSESASRAWDSITTRPQLVLVDCRADSTDGPTPMIGGVGVSAPRALGRGRSYRSPARMASPSTSRSRSIVSLRWVSKIRRATSSNSNSSGSGTR